jgi:23S rRNA (pseudouridine1915-N3)-methyltransferase
VLLPSRLRLIAVGKVRKGWVAEGLALYRRRLPGLEIVEVRDGTPQREAAAILTALRPEERLVALSEEGEGLDSEALATRLSHQGGARLAFAIGGADGLNEEVKRRAQWCLSLSPLTFPHELARLLLLEQLYRARTILEGGPYHRGSSQPQEPAAYSRTHGSQRADWSARKS